MLSRACCAVSEWRYQDSYGDAESCLPLQVRNCTDLCCVCTHRGSACGAVQLQRLLSNLQLSDRGAVTTGEITRSFGWRDSEAFVQHDVQVFAPLLTDCCVRLWCVQLWCVQECMSVIFEHLATGYPDTPLGQHVVRDQQVGHVYCHGSVVRR